METSGVVALAILASVGALNLVMWLWDFIVMKLKSEINRKVVKATT